MLNASGWNFDLLGQLVTTHMVICWSPCVSILCIVLVELWLYVCDVVY